MLFLGKYLPQQTQKEQQLQQRLKAHVEVLAGLIGPRHLGKRHSMQAAVKYVEREFAAMGYSPRTEPYMVSGVETVNVIAEQAGSRRPSEIVIVGAHYDTVPETPGADDNASAIAMLIESARILAAVQHERTVRYVAFACEEPPHFCTDSMGSQHHARGCRVRGERIVGMICLEMVGYYSSNPTSQQVPPGIPRFLRVFFPGRGDFLAVVGNLRSARLLFSFRRGFRRRSRFPLYTVALPERINEIRLSDQSSFWDQNYPALMVTDTSFLRNPNYHRESDTPETLDYPRMTMATLGVASALASIAKGRVRF
jgi:Zn-dependent M28 family amino/carboxypeptidase